MTVGTAPAAMTTDDTPRATPKPATGRRRKRRGPLAQAWHTLGTMRFALYLLLALAIASALAIACGEFWPTTGLADPDAYYATKLSPAGWTAVRALGLLHPYSSWWYAGILWLLCLSLASCIAHRFVPAMRDVFGNVPLEDPAELVGLPVQARRNVDVSWSAEKLAAHLQRAGFRAAVVPIAGNAGAAGATQDRWHVTATRQGAGRLGAILSHFGMLLLFAGGLALVLMSKQDYVWLAQGQTAMAPDSAYTVALDSFLVTSDGQGRVTDYSSYVRVLDGDRVVAQHVIQVNHPLRVGGWNWYQSSYRPVEDRLRRLHLDVVDAEGTSLGHLDLAGTEPAPLPGHPEYVVRMGRFLPHFVIRDGEIRSASREFKNPAVEILVSRADGSETSQQWLFANYPDFQHGETTPWRFRLEGLEPLFATGLHVRSFPGGWLIYAGFGIMTLGLVFSFLLNHQRIWAFGERRGAGWHVHAGGTSMHSASSFAQRFEQIFRLPKATTKEVIS